MPSLRSLRLCGLILLSSLLCSLEARLNLPQRAESIELSEAARKSLQSTLSGVASVPRTLPPEAESLLLENLPEKMRAACAEVVGHWGADAEGTARWSVRALFLAREAAGLTVFLSYRCGSTLPDSLGNFYDERLGALELGAKAGRLRFIPFAEDCADCSELSHLQFSTVFPVESGDLLELRLNQASDNPCCDGPTNWSEERLLYVPLSEPGVALSLVRASETANHDDEAGDTVETCRADIKYLHDAERRVREITAATSCEIDSKPQPATSRRYRWNPSSRRLEEVKPAPAK